MQRNIINTPVASDNFSTEKLPSMEEQGQTDRVTTPMRAGSVAAAVIGCATPHASPR